MTASHTRKFAALGFVAVLSAVGAARVYADTPTMVVDSTAPQAIPPSPTQTPAPQAPAASVPSATLMPAPQSPVAMPVSPTQTQASALSAAATPPQTPPAAFATQPAPAPVPGTSPVEASTAAAAPAAMAPATPTSIATPVEAKPIADIPKDSIGLLASSDGGLGTDIWKDTARAFVDQFMPMLNLPLSYPSLNNLAFRFLSTMASSPDGHPSEGTVSTLSVLRVNKLLALGHSTEAWKLAILASADQIDDVTLRHATEAALIGPSAAEVCAKLPELVKTHTAIEWQMLVAVCQLQAKDNKAAQVSLDLLTTQGVHDETFFDLAEKNVIGGGKNLPRRMTPVQPLDLALVQILNLPLRDEVYARAPAASIEALIKTKAENEGARIGLAERSAASGIIDVKELEDVYRGQRFTADQLTNAANSGPTGGILRALLFQASQNETNPKNRINLGIKFLVSLDNETKGGNMLAVMGEVIGDTMPGSDYYQIGAAVSQIYLLANKKDQALAWLDLTRSGARGMPQVGSDLLNLWPLIAVSGFEAKDDIDKNMLGWMGSFLRPAGQVDADARAQKAYVSSLLLIMDAAGIPVSDEAWAKVADTDAIEKAALPPVLILDLLHNSSAANHRGATILLSLLAATAGKDGPSFTATIDTIRALRLVGLTGEARNLARDATLRFMVANSKL